MLRQQRLGGMISLNGIELNPELLGGEGELPKSRVVEDRMQKAQLTLGSVRQPMGPARIEQGREIPSLRDDLT